jgi:hypothetical protein
MRLKKDWSQQTMTRTAELLCSTRKIEKVYGIKEAEDLNDNVHGKLYKRA